MGYNDNRHHSTPTETIVEGETITTYDVVEVPYVGDSLPSDTFKYNDQNERVSNTAAAAIVNLSGNSENPEPSWGMTI